MSPGELEQRSSTPPHLQPLHVCKLEDMLLRFDKTYCLFSSMECVVEIAWDLFSHRCLFHFS